MYWGACSLGSSDGWLAEAPPQGKLTHKEEVSWTCKVIASYWLLSENRLNALHLHTVAALKTQLWCQVAVVVSILHGGSPYVKLQLVLLGFSGISPKLKLLTERYALIQGLQVVVPAVSEKGFFPEKMPLGIRLPEEMERKFSLHLYRGWKRWGLPSAQCSLVEGKQKCAPQSLFLTHKDSQHQRCCWWLYMTSCWPSPRLLLINTSKAELRAQEGTCHGKQGSWGRRQRGWWGKRISGQQDCVHLVASSSLLPWWCPGPWF